MAPLVSVIVPAWNAERFIGATLRSVAEQTYSNLEIIIVDDGSSDGTAAIAEDFCAADARARVVHQQNGGVASARNRGIAEARGEWIAPVDADDLWHPTKIEKQITVALEAPFPLGFVYCWFHYVDEVDRVIGSGPEWEISGSVLQRLAYSNFVQNGSAMLVSRQAINAVGGYEPALRCAGGQGCEDILIELQIARHFPVAVVPEHLVGYRSHPHAMSRDCRQMVRSWELVCDIIARSEVPIQRRVVRWILARTYLDLAESLFAQRNWRALPGLLARSLTGDMLRTGGYLGYRGARLAARLIRGRRPRPVRTLFSQTSTKSAVVSDPDQFRALSNILAKVDERRMRRLARAETRLEHTEEIMPCSELQQ